MKLAFSAIDDREVKPFVVDVPDNPRIEPEILIGRARNCDIQIPKQFVSRRHCGIRIDPLTKAVQVHDFGSENGTFVNDKPVAGLCNVVDGDTLTVGFLSLTVHIEGTSVWERIAAKARAAQLGEPRKMKLVAD
jgi:pSer/pThr/pTyr-binding forkhead associated (FHA) protein